MKKFLGVMAVSGLLVSGAGAAPEIVRLDSLQAAAYGASYMTIIEAEDLAAFTQTNGTHGVTSAVPAKVGLTMAGMILEEAFNDSIALGAANAVTNSILLTIGDGSDADYFLSSTQIAEDGTEVFVQFAPIGGQSVTAQTLALTGTVQNVSVVTNIVTALTGQKYYSSAGNVVYTFAGAGGTIPANLTKGRLKVYWRELK